MIVYSAPRVRVAKALDLHEIADRFVGLLRRRWLEIVGTVSGGTITIETRYTNQDDFDAHVVAEQRRTIDDLIERILDSEPDRQGYWCDRLRRCGRWRVACGWWCCTLPR